MEVDVMEVCQSLPVGSFVSKGEYRRKYASRKFYKEMKTLGICCYVLCGIQAAMIFVLGPTVLIDLVLMLGLSLGMHLGKSKGCAIALLVYSVLSCVLSLVVNGTLSAWMWIVVSFSALRLISKVDKEYDRQMEERRAQ